MGVSEIKMVTIGVADIQRSKSFYNQGFGFVEFEQGVLEDKRLDSLWQIPPGLNGKYCVMGLEGIRSGMLRLLQFDAPGKPIWGDYSRIQDLGHYALNFRVKDIKTGWPRLLAAGAKEKSAPKFWEVNADISAWDSMCYDPEGVLLDVFEVQGNIDDSLGQQATDASEVQTMAIHVSDAVKSKEFYTGLGYGVLYDKVVEKMEGFFGLPDGVSLHNINLINPDHSPNGRIEIVEYKGFPGKQLKDLAVPPNLGLLSISFETADLEELALQLENTPAILIQRPVELNFSVPGKMKASTYYGPDGEVLEFFQLI